MTNLTSRRNILKGTIGGAAVTVGLPFLDTFLNANGTALAETGKALPTVFGTWFQYLGFNPGRWVPEKIGGGFTNNIELKAFDPFRQRMNLVSGANYFLDGRPVETHRTGAQIATLGGIPTGRESGPSVDSVIADTIGKGTRFRSIEVSLTGSRQSYSKRAGAGTNPSEVSPETLYKRIFGPDFQDPNASEFKPDPKVMAKQSVLSAVAEQRHQIMKQLGASDRARLDEYFTSVRQIENQLAMKLEKPAPLPACSAPGAAKEIEPGEEVEQVSANTKVFSSLLAHAAACGQTRVFNVLMNTQGSRKPGSTNQWHGYTHEEPIDEKLGYQKEVTWFILWANQVFADFVHTLEQQKEGAGSVMDRTLILWQTDHGYARTHTMDNLPVITVGNAGGRFKTGLHLPFAGDPATRVGLTVMQGFGVPMGTWGALSNQTSKPVTEILA
jgi:hypothetical protein